MIMAVNSRLLVRLKKMHDGSQSCYCELVELTDDDLWQIADAGDQELWRLAQSSRRHMPTLERGDEDKRAVTASAYCSQCRSSCISQRCPQT